MPLLALYNPIAGDGTAEAFLRNHVIPILLQHGKIVDQISATQSAEHSAQLLINFLKTGVSQTAEITIILCSGDGTLHDIVNGLQSSLEDEDSLVESYAKHLNFVLVPCGTANALFASLFPPKEGDALDIAYKMQSLQAYIHKQPPRPTPLTLAQTVHVNAQRPPHTTIALVVVSTSLHASILQDSEKLRDVMPGIERFKVAAKTNETKWYRSRLKLYPSAAMSSVQLYDPKVKAFVTHPHPTDGSLITLEGPFSYFLSTTNVDRLEPNFQIAPLSKKLPSIGASCDLVIIRPLRDPSISQDDYESRGLFASKLWSIMQSAYEGGRHIDLQYDNSGKICRGGDGPTVVEYIRCGGWEWIPDVKSTDLDANLLCSDGAISHIERGGQVIYSVVSPDRNAIMYTIST